MLFSNWRVKIESSLPLGMSRVPNPIASKSHVRRLASALERNRMPIIGAESTIRSNGEVPSCAWSSRIAAPMEWPSANQGRRA